MKQKFLYLAMAAMAMASCSQDETIDVYEGKGIGFRAESPAGTRATEVNNQSLTDFWVTALYESSGAPYFSDVKFAGQEGGYYTSSPSYNWPGSDKLIFHAIYPSATDLGTLTLSKTEQKLENFTVKSVIADQKDFVYATATGDKSNEEDGVALTFNHMLSQIEVQAFSKNDVYDFKVKGVVIGKIPSTANLTDFSNRTWSNTSEPITYKTTELAEVVTLNSNAANLMGTDGNAMLIPQTLTPWAVADDKQNTDKGAYIGVYLQITTKEGNRVYPRKEGVDFGYACMPISTTWEAGKHYVYKLDFSDGAGYVDPEKPIDPTDPDKPGEPIFGGGIKFTVDVTDWKPEGGQDVPVDME